eukprot:5245255-Amphidinium_carterae.1
MLVWQLFMVCELNGNHRAARDPPWAQLLARVRVGEHTDEDIEALKRRARKTVPPEAVRLFATRAS